MSKIKSDIINEFKRLKQDALVNLTHQIQKSTVAIFIMNKKKQPVTVGSGVLLEINNKKFLITATHVIQDRIHELFISSKEEHVTLGGTIYSTQIPASGKQEDDKIDITFCELSQTVLDVLGDEFEFLKEIHLGINHTPVSTPNYLVVGYPSSKTKLLWNSNILKSEIFNYQTQISKNFDYKKYSFEEKQNLAFDFDGLVKSEKLPNPHYAPKLEGISGCGVYYFTLNNILDFKLVGIMLERVYNHEHKSIVCTNICLFTEYLRQVLNINVAKSVYFRIGFLPGSSTTDSITENS